jgi:predicted nucleotidyltransferase
MELLEQVKAKRQEILAAAARYGASNVRIIGSVARGDAGPESDVDVLVSMEPDRSLLDRAGLLLDLQDILGRKVDVATERGLRPRVRESVMHDAVPL